MKQWPKARPILGWLYCLMVASTLSTMPARASATKGAVAGSRHKTNSGITTIAQLRRATDLMQGALCPVHLEAVVCWTDPQEALLALQDDSGAALFEFDLRRQPLHAGERVIIEGDCAVEGSRFNLRRDRVVDNDGLHGMIEKSGTIFLKAGKHPVHVRWFDKEAEYGLEVIYQGPDMPRQKIPNSALFTAIVDPVSGTTNWINGLEYRSYEGDWNKLPDFRELKPIHEGRVDNFDLTVKSRTNHVALQFAGYLEVPRDGLYTFFTISDDGSELCLDDQQTRVTVTAKNSFPKPRSLSPGQNLPEEDCRWAQVEGKATFIGKTPKGFDLEISSAGGKMIAELPEVPGICPSLLLNCQLRVQGFCQSTYAQDGQRIAGRLLVPGPEQVEVLTEAPQLWSAYAVSPITNALRLSFGEANQGIVHLRGRASPMLGERALVLEDGTGQVSVELSQPAPQEAGAAVEVLGKLYRTQTNSILLSGLFREAADKEVQSPSALPLLASIEQVHRLKRGEAENEYPVQVRGVVTYATQSDAVVQDSSRGVYALNVARLASTPLRLGEYLEVEGVTGSGDFAPVINGRRITRLGPGRLPEPARPSWDQLMNGSVDCQYIEIEGIVTSTQTNALTLLLRDGRLQVDLADSALTNLIQFENAHVRMRGCCLAAWDAPTHQVISGLIHLCAASIHVEELAPQNLFAASAKQIDELLQFDPRAGAFQRVKVSGQILHSRNREYYLTDGTNGLRFFVKEPAQLRLGDEAEVVGFPELGGPSPILREAVARKTGTAPAPAPRPLSPETLLNSTNDSTLVQVDSRLVGLSSNDKDQLLELQSGSRIFVARLSWQYGLLPPLSIGSRLRLTGVYTGRGGNRAAGEELDSFELLLNSPADIKVLRRPSWWTTAHTMTVLGALIFVLLLAAGWISALRRKVEQRTGELREEIEERKRTGTQLEEKAKLLAAEIEERERIQQEMESIHKELLVTSRQAGMAEVATSVLHNVGNVLNSVNVSANLVSDQIKRSKAANLVKVADLVQQHSEDLGEFITRDPKGRQVPLYLKQLAQHLNEEQSALLTELQSLAQNIEHIKDIVAMQQNYARLAGVTETVPPSELIEDALRMNAGALSRHDVQIIRDYDPEVPAIIVEKHKVLQVLVNLVQNAKYACDESGRTDKQLKVRVSNGDDRVKIWVIDNGIGILPENLTRIFNHGFTTRRNGHGFGLHSGALAAKELGGALLAYSEGPGTGATFCLELPIQPP